MHTPNWPTLTLIAAAVRALVPLIRDPVEWVAQDPDRTVPRMTLASLRSRRRQLGSWLVAELRRCTDPTTQTHYPLTQVRPEEITERDVQAVVVALRACEKESRDGGATGGLRDAPVPDVGEGPRRRVRRA